MRRKTWECVDAVICADMCGWQADGGMTDGAMRSAGIEHAEATGHDVCIRTVREVTIYPDEPTDE